MISDSGAAVAVVVVVAAAAAAAVAASVAAVAAAVAAVAVVATVAGVAVAVKLIFLLRKRNLKRKKYFDRKQGLPKIFEGDPMCVCRRAVSVRLV